MPKSFSGIIDLWEPKIALARQLGIPDQNVKKWWMRDSIPPSYWLRVIALSEKLPPHRRRRVTLKLLATLAEQGGP